MTNLKEKIADTIQEPSEFLRAVTRSKPSNIDREGGQYGAGLIEGAAIVTRGEALGHGYWLDSEFVASVHKALSSSRGGIKSRFTHPDMSGDGLGKHVGRAKDGEQDGDIVRADLHFTKTSHSTPDGDLSGYIMNLAEESPEDFGMSIVFKPDRGASDKHRAMHCDKDGIFKSPDKMNTKNLPHARLAELYGVDVVDEPAANPSGMFHRESPALEFDAVAEYAFGLSNAVPETSHFNIHPERVKAFASRFLDQKGLEIVKKEKSMSTPATPPVETPAAPVTPAPAVPAPVNLSAEQLAAERKRVKEIRTFGTKHGASEELMAQAIDDGWSVEKFGLAAFTAGRADAPAPVRVDVLGNPAKEEMPAALSAGMRMAMNVGVSEADKKLAAKHGVSRLGSIHALARFCCGMEGKTLPWNASENDLRLAAISTSSFPEALSDSFNNSVQMGYAQASHVFLDIFGRKPVKDFKAHKNLLFGAFTRPSKVGAGGELPYTQFTEGKEGFRVDTYGFIFTLTRQMWINDDIGIFTSVPQELGKTMGDEFDQQGCDLLTYNSGVGPTMETDSQAMFYASRTEVIDNAGTTQTCANIFTGSGSAFKTSALSQAAKALMSMRHGNRVLNLQPAWALFNPTNYWDGKRMLESPMLIAGTNLTSTELEGGNNVFNNFAKPYVSARLLNKANPTTRWYLGADQKGANPALAAVTLNGVETPTVEEVTLPAEILGRGWRCYFDMAWAALDWRSVICNVGA